jgi:short-subunit dehydrogenase
MASTALITGASGGIGREIATILASEGCDCVLVARDASKLAELARTLEAAHGVRTLAIDLDLSADDAPARLLEQLERGGLPAVDILINNAGFATFGLFAQTELAAEIGELHLNVVTLTVLTKLLLPGMLARRRGEIMNVGSTGSFISGPYMATYCATKNYVLSFSEALAEEVRGTGVSVTCLCPGPTASGFQERAGMAESPLVKNAKMPDAHSVAAFGVKAMHAKKILAIPGAGNQIVPLLVRLLPRGVIPRIVRRAQAPRAR